MLIRLAVFSCALASVAAQSTVVPAANASARGTSQLNTIVRNSGNPRTYMLGISAAELTSVPVGATLNGASFRFQVFASNSPSWPPADITWTDYQIFVGPVNPIASLTGNFMANFSSPPTQVRSGSMVLPANTYTNTSPPPPTPNAWGEFYFDFQTPHVYGGGDLGVLFSHPGSTDPTTAQYLEVVPSSAGSYGVAFTQSAYPVGSAGISTTFYVHRLHWGYGVGCPGTGGKVPNLVQNQNIVGGGTLQLTVSNAPPTTACAFVFGAGRTSLTLPNGCPLLTLPLVSLVAPTDALGRAVLAIPVPPGLRAALNVQAAVLDPGASGSFTTTNGVEPTSS